ncbi:hypothetical protein PMIN01_00416 [Paraphaeosphaeria minitans]|uniref:Uncharacterized protein n=1 Tax=Paraphaeosphaeria minitans TaxID=565426 RepID=A0A9P6GS68_9PLEO|nr:hypothetical protein PMIN01_00416 [Paraphaeosphaeria minitans]
MSPISTMLSGVLNRRAEGRPADRSEPGISKCGSIWRRLGETGSVLRKSPPHQLWARWLFKLALHGDERPDWISKLRLQHASTTAEDGRRGRGKLQAYRLSIVSPFACRQSPASAYARLLTAGKLARFILLPLAASEGLRWKPSAPPQGAMDNGMKNQMRWGNA